VTRLLLRGPLRGILQGVYNRLFWLLSGQSTDWLARETQTGEREP